MLLIVGLGNPGKEYENTYHNMGFKAIDELSIRNGFLLNKSKCKSDIFEGKILGNKVVVAKPQTYMNLSGEAVVELKNKFKPDKIYVIYDDIDLPQGTFRYRETGSAGTHNGMRNIIKLLGTQDIARIRIGIKPETEIYDLADFVLSKCKGESLEKVENAIDEALDFLENEIKTIQGNVARC